MNQFSESQRQRAEQNRLKALEIRKQKLAALGTSGTPPCTPGPPKSTATSLNFIPSPPNPTSRTSSTSAVPQGGVGATKFYTSSSLSGGNHSTLGSSKTQPTTHPGDLGVSGPPAKNPRIEVPKTTSTLPPGVLKKIEENKRKAQERQEALRRAREQGSNIPQVFTAPKGITQPTSKPSSSTSDAKNVNPVASKFTTHVTVSFVLSSINTFRASTTMYHAATIQVFKTMTSRSYDYNKKLWTFQISEHRKLVAALRPLHPEVEVQPLPQFVLTAVEAAAKKVPADYIDLFGLDSRLLDALMPFQTEGVKFGISLGGRVMLADDMGLGKTIQALGIACHYRSEWPLLVVTPSSMRYSWEESILRWVSSVSGQDVQVMSTGGDNFREAKVVVTTYDLLSRKAELMLHHNFGVVIFDESHMIKSYKSARYKAAAPLMKKLKRVIMLTGTPAMSRPLELYTQISGIDPSLFPHFHDFGVRYCEGRKEAWGWTFRGSSNTEELQIILQSCVLIRRLKSEVLSQLPPKQRMTVVLDPGLIKNKKIFEGMGHKIQSLSRVESGDCLQMFAKTAEMKANAVREYLREVLESDKKFLVFAHHMVMLSTICSLCEETKTKYIRIDGNTSAEERMARTSKFQNQEEVKVAVLSITAANTGLTLTAAQLVIFAELYWNPGILVQAEDRAHRIGQEDSVMVQYLVARTTADDHIWPLIQNKLEVLGKVGLSNDQLNEAKTSYQKCAAEPDIRDFLHNTGKQESPRKSAAASDIRSFLKPQNQAENSDPNWNA